LGAGGGSAAAARITGWITSETIQPRMTGLGARERGSEGAMSETGRVITSNRQAYHDYFVDETVEAGIALTGTEVKSIREGHVNLRGAYARVANGEVWLEGAHIAEYEQGTYLNHEPLRRRKLLLHRREINRLVGKVQQKGLTLIPLKLYFSGNRVKIELGLAHGKKLYDKRAAIKERESAREIARVTKHRQRE
jgi:SsrA-binding protein